MIFNLGSINADHTYRVAHLPTPGETLSAINFTTGLGGKGANQSVAAARAGATVRHIGAVGHDGAWAVDRLQGFGIDTRYISTVAAATGHANVFVDPAGENQIVLHPGANRAQDVAGITAALADAASPDWLMLQNETSHQDHAARIMHSKGGKVAYSAAPFDPQAVGLILPHIDLLILNAVEAAQLSSALDIPVPAIPVPAVLVTKGAGGADWIDRIAGKTVSVKAFKVDPVDTTGAGDTFAGYMIAALSQGLTPKQGLVRASAAAALHVTRKGTADVIPDLAEVMDFLG